MRANRKLQESLWMISVDKSTQENCEFFEFDISKTKPYNSRTKKIVDNTRDNVVNLFN